MAYYELWPGQKIGKTQEWADELKKNPFSLPKFNAKDASQRRNSDISD